MENIYNYDEIEQYLSNELIGEALEDFEQRLSTDKKFKEAVNLRKDTITAFESLDEDDFLAKVSNVENELNQEGFFISEEDFDTIIFNQTKKEDKEKFDAKISQDNELKKDFEQLIKRITSIIFSKIG